MSKPRYKWWGYAKAVIRAYPAHCKELSARREQKITSAYSGNGHASGAHRATEGVALRELKADDMREYIAVENAIAHTRTIWPDAEERLRLIELVFFRQSHSLQSAAFTCNVSYSTAKRWHNNFIVTVANYLGLISEGTGKTGMETEVQCG